MNKSSVLFSVIALGFVGSLQAADSDSRFGDSRWYGGRSPLSENSLGNSGNTPLYYRPTQRYYGPGYTVNYRYVAVYRGDTIREASVTGATNFRSDAFKLSADDVAAWGATSPKITVRDARSGAPRTAVTSIVRKKTASKPTTGAAVAPATDAAPVISPAATDSAAPVPVAPKP